MNPGARRLPLDEGEQRRQVCVVLLPVKAPDLPFRQPDEGVAVLQRVVEKGKRMVFGQGDEPERELGHFGRKWVDFDAVHSFNRKPREFLEVYFHRKHDMPACNLLHAAFVETCDYFILYFSQLAI